MFTWKPIYVELAEKLLAYRGKQDELLSWLDEMRDAGLSVIRLQDESRKGTKIPLTVIDPFTFFANFNRGIKHTTRIEILRRLKAHMQLSSPLPDDFNGVPLANNLQAWYFPYLYHRNEQSIPRLWDLAEQVVTRAAADIDSGLFAECLGIASVGPAKLTMGLFWMLPDRYLALDQLNVSHLSEQEIDPKRLKAPGWTAYLQLLDEVRGNVGDDFPSISHAAYSAATKVAVDPGKLNKGFRDLLQRTAERNDCPVAELVEWMKNGGLVDGQNDITNRTVHQKELGALLRSGDLDEESLLKAVNKLWVLGGRQDSIYRNGYFKSGEALTDIKALLDDEDGIPLLSRINNFVDAALEHGYHGRKSPDRTCVAQFASAILAAYHPDRFVDVRKGRWNKLYREILQTNKMLLRGQDYGFVLLRAGSFATQLTQTPTFRRHFSNAPELWTIAGICWLFRNGVFAIGGSGETEVEMDSEEDTEGTVNEAITVPPAKNLILYGPPGTGKTYKTMRLAVEQIDTEVPTVASELKARFDQLVEQSRIAFVTFHQSYSYEDFVEGIRPVMDEEDPTAGPRYECRDGIFKKLCAAARAKTAVSQEAGEIDLVSLGIWKMSLGDTHNPEDAHIFADCIAGRFIGHGAGRGIDFGDHTTKTAIEQILSEEDWDDYASTLTHHIQQINLLRNDMRIGDLVIITDGNHKFRAIGKVAGDYRCDPAFVYEQQRPVEWLRVFEESQPKERILRHKSFSQLTLYRLYQADLKLEAPGGLLASADASDTDNYVLIIDEINRGNMSKILGELITLIEPDKREGQPNQLTVTLPYSQEQFSVPSNLHLIGTMNTADKSIALVDVALRRRFQFRELMPDFTLCPDMPEATYHVLREMNKRITMRKDRDHQIGHAYFMNVSSKDAFNDVFRRCVLPLLQEYFYNDWDGLRYVLGEAEAGAGKFIVAIPDSNHKWARNRWQWYYENAAQDLDFLGTLQQNYKLAGETGD